MLPLARLLTALLAFTLLAANSASAITAASVEKPASGLFGVLEQHVGTDALASASRVDEKLSLLYDFVSDFPVAARGIRYGPLNPGPLADDIAATFRSGSYAGRTLDQPTTLYRAIGDKGNPTGSFWTATEPRGPLQSVIDSALDQNWGNTATQVIRARVPAGTTIYEGAAAAQRGLVGGGSQVYIPRVDSPWILPQ